MKIIGQGRPPTLFDLAGAKATPSARKNQPTIPSRPVEICAQIACGTRQCHSLLTPFYPVIGARSVGSNPRPQGSLACQGEAERSPVLAFTWGRGGVSDSA